MDYKKISPFKNIIHTKQFNKDYLFKLFKLTKKLKTKKIKKTLKGKIVALLFYEPSTRTKFSFESAVIRLGGDIISTENASMFSSFVKKETIEDTMRMVNKYADALVIRCKDDLYPTKALSVAEIPVINAGSGTTQHPTQSLLDVYTIYEKFKKIDNLNIVFVGDLLRGRTINSLLYILAHYNNTFTFVSIENSQISNEMKAFLKEKEISYTETNDLKDVIKNADVCYMTRVQEERFDNADEYEKAKGQFIMTGDLANTMKKESIILHPLPRVDEITHDVDLNNRAWYFKQAENGLFVRMALLSMLDYK